MLAGLQLTTLTGAPADLPAERALLARLARACSPATLRQRFFLPADRDPEFVLAAYGRYLLAGPPAGLALVAVLAGRPVGLLNLVADGTPGAAGGQLDLAVLVADHWQRRGIGRTLVEAALRRHPGRPVRATVQPGNDAALALLRSQPGVRLVSGTRGEWQYELGRAG